MKIVISHLTRMQKGCICAAGVESDAGRHVRPVMRQQMPVQMLAEHGGPFAIGSIVELGQTRRVGRPPEVEDQLFFAANVCRLGTMPPEEFWQLLLRLAKPRLVDIFGSQLQRRGQGSCAVPQARGRASLGCFQAQSPRLLLRHSPDRVRIRMCFRSGPHDFDVPVTDVRLFQSDHVTPDPLRVELVARRLQSADTALLGVGLTRAFRKTAAEPAMHWLQVNNIHLADDPYWQSVAEAEPAHMAGRPC